MMQVDIVTALVIAAVTGGISTVGTVMALKVHITYLREAVTRLDAAIARAHHRIDVLEQRGPHQ